MLRKCQWHTTQHVHQDHNSGIEVRLVQHEQPDADGGQFQPPSTISEGIMPVHDSLIAGKMVKMAAKHLPSQGPQNSTETTTAAYALHC